MKDDRVRIRHPRGELQLRGHCQCCGREQAVIDGRITAHGAERACPGAYRPPLQAQREIADRTIARVRSDAWTLTERALAFYERRVVPPTAETFRRGAGGRPLRVPFAQASRPHQDEEVRREIDALEAHARRAREFADELARLADECFCEPLREIRWQNA